MASCRGATASVKKNLFIVVESSDGAGGSTQVSLLTRRLKREGLIAQQLHFPREDAPTGQVVYGKFLHAKNKAKFSRREQALLYIQDFFAGSSVITDMLTKKAKKYVAVSDRFCTSTMAYQTIGLVGDVRTRMLEWITWICWAGEPRLPKPDVVILLDLPISVSLRRIDTRKDKKTKDYFENRKKQLAIRRSYLRLAKEQRWVIINCADKTGQQRAREDIHQDVWHAVSKLIG